MIRTDNGVIWRGVVQDTGESAILLWWWDGRLTGVRGYKGHVYVVMNMGGDLHAVLEADPKRTPPDHPTLTRMSVPAMRAPFPTANTPFPRSSRFPLPHGPGGEEDRHRRDDALHEENGKPLYA